MKQKEQDMKQPEREKRSGEEEQMLNLDELMDVQGGVEEKDIPNCGLGCYTGGWVDPTKTQDEPGRKG